MKKDIIHFAFVLGIISIAAALGVAGVYQVTITRIEQKRQVAFQKSLQEVFPDAASFVVVAAPAPAIQPNVPNAPEEARAWEGAGVGKAVAKDGRTLGYLAVGEKQGYSSRIRVLVAAVDSTPMDITPTPGPGEYLTIKEVRILFSSETPGLGEKAREVPSDKTLWQAIGIEKGEGGAARPWLANFQGKTLDKLVVVKGSGEGIPAITAATVTSSAVTEAVKAALEEIKTAIGGQARYNSGKLSGAPAE